MNTAEEAVDRTAIMHHHFMAQQVIVVTCDADSSTSKAVLVAQLFRKENTLLFLRTNSRKFLKRASPEGSSKQYK